jgi:hypothetical protein
MGKVEHSKSPFEDGNLTPNLVLSISQSKEEKIEQKSVRNEMGRREITPIK